jgi:hypothetical protein
MRFDFPQFIFFIFHMSFGQVHERNNFSSYASLLITFSIFFNHFKINEIIYFSDSHARVNFPSIANLAEIATEPISIINFSTSSIYSEHFYIFHNTMVQNDIFLNKMKNNSYILYYWKIKKIFTIFNIN